MWNLAVTLILVAGVIPFGGTALGGDAPVTGTFDTHEVSFLSHGVTLSGAVIVPRSPVVAAVVFVQGAGSDLRPESQGVALARLESRCLYTTSAALVDQEGFTWAHPAASM